MLAEAVAVVAELAELAEVAAVAAAAMLLAALLCRVFSRCNAGAEQGNSMAWKQCMHLGNACARTNNKHLTLSYKDT